MLKIKRISPARLIVIGFAIIILIGTVLLALPISANEGVKITILDALFTSTSAVCVTGLVVHDTADAFSIFGRTVIAILIQTGGLGISSVGIGLILLAGKKVTFKERMMVKEALNLESMKGIVKIVKIVFLLTISFELIGAILSFIVFSKDFPTTNAIGISIFHAISAFNNAGFDILGEYRSLTQYHNNILLNFTTIGLVIFGGLGFYVMKDVIFKRSFKKLTLHSKIVLTMTGILLVTGTLIIKLTEDISWMGAFFHSTSARTAGFSTFAMDGFSNAGLFFVILLMFIGASPGSTGGGVKTTTMFILAKSAYSMSTNRYCAAFKRKIPHEIVMKAFVIALLSVLLICLDTFIISILEPQFDFREIFFEVVSAFGTVGLSTGITPELGLASRVIIIITMFTGRLGPLTIASIWYNRPATNVSYSEESLTIG